MLTLHLANVMFGSMMLTMLYRRDGVMLGWLYVNNVVLERWHDAWLACMMLTMLYPCVGCGLEWHVYVTYVLFVSD